MCKIVYLTSKRFDRHSKDFKEALAEELQDRGIKVVQGKTCYLPSIFCKTKVYGMAIGIDFFKDGSQGCGLMLSRKCNAITRSFAFELSNLLDTITPAIRWRDLNFVEPSNRVWRHFFGNIHAETKTIFYLCTKNNPDDFEHYSTSFEKIVKAFADEIVRCVRSDYNNANYQARVKRAKLKITKVTDGNGMV